MQVENRNGTHLLNKTQIVSDSVLFIVDFIGVCSDPYTEYALTNTINKRINKKNKRLVLWK